MRWGEADYLEMLEDVHIGAVTTSFIFYQTKYRISQIKIKMLGCGTSRLYCSFFM